MARICTIFGGMILITGVLFVIATESPERTSAATASPYSEWVDIRLIDQPSVAFTASWLSREEWAWPEDEYAFDEDGHFVSMQGEKLSENVLHIDESQIRSLFEAGEPTQLPIPANTCEIALRWSSETSSVWWQEWSPNGVGCGVEGNSSDENGSSISRWGAQLSAGTTHAQVVGMGRILFTDEGHVEVGCFEYPPLGIHCTAAPQKKRAVLCAEDSTGDIYFWSVEL